MNTFKRPVIILLFLLSCPVSAEVISVDTPNKGSDPTLTFYMPGQNSRALILLLPGGEGMLNLKPGMTELNAGVVPILKRLTDPSRTSGQYDVVAMDSPYSLKVSRGGGGARGTSDHMERIESVAKYYTEKTRLPIILMGHSNGTLSASWFVRYVQEKNAGDLINGLVLSSSRNEVSISPPMNMPVIVMHHAQDGCQNTSYSTDRSRYEKVVSFNKSLTLFITITTGSGVPGNACESGFHMLFDADDEVSRKLDENLTKVLFVNH